MTAPVNIIFDGPLGSGKTSCMHCLEAQLAAPRRSDLVCATGHDGEAASFDWLRVDVEQSDAKVRAHVISGPGQHAFGPRRRALLKLAHAAVFVVDSNPTQVEAARPAFEELVAQVSVERVVVLANKQDLQGACSPDQIATALGGGVQVLAGAAREQRGVVEALERAVDLAEHPVEAPPSAEPARLFRLLERLDVHDGEKDTMVPPAHGARPTRVGSAPKRTVTGVIRRTDGDDDARPWDERDAARPSSSTDAVLTRALRLEGVFGAALASHDEDRLHGASTTRSDLDLRAIVNAHRATIAAERALLERLGGALEEIAVTLGDQHHVVRLLPDDSFILVVTHREVPVGLTHHRLAQLQRDLDGIRSDPAPALLQGPAPVAHRALARAVATVRDTHGATEQAS